MQMISRAQWGAAAPVRRSPGLVKAKLRGVAYHWPGTAGTVGAESLAGVAARLRGYQRFHTLPVAKGGRGWADIAYNYAVDQSGRVYVLRGWVQGGHAKGAQNTEWVGVLCVLGNSEKPTDAMLAALADLHDWIEAQAGKALTAAGHTNLPGANKPCPGVGIMGWIARGRPRPNNEMEDEMSYEDIRRALEDHDRQRDDEWVKVDLGDGRPAYEGRRGQVIPELLQMSRVDMPGLGATPLDTAVALLYQQQQIITEYLGKLTELLTEDDDPGEEVSPDA